MENTIKVPKPTTVFTYFKEINQIPRCSGNERAISDYMVLFANKYNLEVVQDEWLNIIIKKNGTKGYENAPITILQGHLDMVCEKNKGSQHDFNTDPIDFIIDGEWLKANNTTLGADNGIAIAYIMSILASTDIPHPPIEAVFTTDEEVGLTGAIKMDKNGLNAKYFINLDSEEEGEITVGCAGGLKSSIVLPVTYVDSISNKISYQGIDIKNLIGGHSGAEIDKNRSNADQLMGRILNYIYEYCTFNLVDINGGTKDNVIPRECFSIIAIDEKDISDFRSKLGSITKEIKNETKTSDPDITISNKEIFDIDENKIISQGTTEKLLFLLLTVPNGIQTMSNDLEGMVESSLNIGKCVKEDDEIVMLFAVRSNIESLKYHISNRLKAFAKIIQAKYIETADYPEWAFNPESDLITKATDVYKEITGKEPIVKSIHAGLEGGVFLKDLPDMEALSFGPDMEGVHSPDERLNIESTRRTWKYLLALLKAIKE